MSISFGITLFLVNMRFDKSVLLSTIIIVIQTKWTRAASVGSKSTCCSDLTPAENVQEVRDQLNARKSTTAVNNTGIDWNSIKAVPRELNDVFSCVFNQWNNHSDSCIHSFTSWFYGEDTADNQITERKKSKLKHWDAETLLYSVGLKLLFFLPLLAVLAGKAISFSLISFIITSGAFLLKPQLETAFKRGDFHTNAYSPSSGYFM